MKKVCEHIPGYSYGTSEVTSSPVSMDKLQELKISAGFTEEDERYLKLAGEAFSDQTKQIVDQWRNRIIAGIPHLARHSRNPDGEAIPDYLARSNLRFQQWILDTCLRPYDQAWLDYQHEIALRHTILKKNKTDNVRSTSYVPFSDIIAFVAIINETIKPYLAAKGNSAAEVDKMHRAWCKAIQLQLALWTAAFDQAARLQSKDKTTGRSAETLQSQ